MSDKIIRVGLDAHAGCLQVQAARLVARTLIDGFVNCQEESMPLTDLQKIELLATAIQEFDGTKAEIVGMAVVEARMYAARESGVEVVGSPNVDVKLTGVSGVPPPPPPPPPPDGPTGALRVEPGLPKPDDGKGA